MNWGPTTAPNDLLVELFGTVGGYWTASETGSPKTIRFTASNMGPYYSIHIKHMGGSTIGYNLSVAVGSGNRICSTLVFPGNSEQRHSAVNDLGDIILTSRDASGFYQLYQTLFRQLDAADHRCRSITTHLP